MSIHFVAGKLKGEERKAIIQRVQKQMQEAALGAIKPRLSEFCEEEPTVKLGRGKREPNRRQVKPAPSQASKRREVLGRSERPAMERPAACLIASPIRRRACVNDKRPQKPCASTTV